MMDSPFFRNRFANPSSWPRHSPTASRSVPVHGPSSPAAAPTPRRKVISVPVVSVESETKRSSSAVKIQKVFRGLLVRKSVKKIMAIRSEVKAIERRLSFRETIDLIRGDSKERLKLNEMLMTLLFRLDSVRGVDSGVRDCRKAVIKKAIALQEAIDAIVAGDYGSNTVVSEESDNRVMNGSGDTVDVQKSVHREIVADPIEEMQCQGLGTEDSDDRALETDDCKETDHQQRNDSCRSDDETLVIQNTARSEIAVNTDSDQTVDNIDRKEIVYQVSNHDEITVDRDAEFQCEELGSDVCVDRALKVGDSCNCDRKTLEFQNSGVCDIVVNQDVDLHKSAEDSGNRTAKIDKSVDSDGVENETMEIEGAVDIDNPDDLEEVIKSVVVNHEGNDENAKNEKVVESEDNRELLKRIADDNAKLMGLMNEFLEKNETQTKMLSNLTQRVQKLEAAFVCERLRRKKRHAVATLTDAESGTPKDQKKCGNK